MNDLEKLFHSELSAIYDGEQQLVRALAELEQKAAASDLKSAFGDHAQQTKEHVRRLEQVFSMLSMPSRRKPCHGITGIIDEGMMAVEDFKGHSILDSVLAASALKVEHFEIAAYGTLCSWAKKLENEQVLQLLKETISEEKQAESRLSSLAETMLESPSTRWSRADLRILFLRYLRAGFDAEHLLVNALAEVEFYANSRLLRFAVHLHRSQTEKHASRLEQVFRAIGETIDRKPCDGIEGIIDDAQVTVMEFLGNSALDAGLIAVAQRAEHYEIAMYHSLILWAHFLGEDDVIAVLDDNLSDEISTDKKLSLAAEYLRNPKAAKQDTSKHSAEEAEFLKMATHAG